MEFTIRGLHWQEPQQAKFVRVLEGSIVDVCVRLSDGHVFRFDMAKDDTLMVPTGYAHGFCTQEPYTLVSYKVSERFAPDAQYGINPLDPHLAIDWGIFWGVNPIMSEKDRNAPSFTMATRGEAA